MGTNQSIEEEIKLGESQSLEFKKSLSQWSDAGESLGGMLNTDAGQGAVIFGMKSKETITGIEPGSLDTAQQTIRQRIVPRFDPPIVISIETAELSGKVVMRISAERSRDVPLYEYDGRAFIREGTTTRQLSLEEKLDLIERRTRGSRAQSLFEQQLAETVQRFEERNPLGKEYQGYREVATFPSRFDAGRFSLELLQQAVEQGVGLADDPFLPARFSSGETYAIQDGLETLITYQVFRDRLIFWQLRSSGFCYHRQLMWEDVEGWGRSKPSTFVGIASTIYYVTEALCSLLRLYEFVGVSGEEMTVRFRLLGTESKLLARDSRKLPWLLNHSLDNARCRLQEIVWQYALPIEEWNAGIVDHSVTICEEIFKRFNWLLPNTSLIRQLIKDYPGGCV